MLVEALTEAAIKEGLPRDVAQALARHTVSGAGALLDAEKTTPSDLGRNVTSPGGTTEAALKILMAEDGLVELTDAQCPPPATERVNWALERRAFRAQREQRSTRRIVRLEFEGSGTVRSEDQCLFG